MKHINIIYSTISGLLFQILTIILAFALRTVMIKQLGTEYIALITVFSSIAGLLVSLDGGMASTVFIKIHKPIATNDENEIKRIFNMIKAIYFIRAILVCLFSCVIVFILPWLIGKTTIDLTVVYISFALYMGLSAFSIYIVYKTFMVEALQLRYKVTNVLIVVTLFCYIANIVQLILLKNFFIYIALLTAIQIIVSLKINKIIYEKLPFLSKAKINFREVKLSELFELSKMMLHSLSDVFVKNSDNLIITKIINLETVGIFSNYRMITLNLENMVVQFLLAIKDPLRNKMASNDSETMKEIHDIFIYICFLLANVVCVGIIVLINNLIANIWLSAQWLLPIGPTFFLVAGMFVFLTSYPIIDAYFFNNCYTHDMKTPIIEIILNIVISIILGTMLGLVGVFIGTFVYQLYRMTKRSYVYYKDVYNRNNLEFLSQMFKYFIVFIGCIMICFALFSLFTLTNVYLDFIVKIILCALISFLLPLMLFRSKSKLVIKKFLDKRG